MKCTEVARQPALKEMLGVIGPRIKMVSGLCLLALVNFSFAGAGNEPVPSTRTSTNHSLFSDAIQQNYLIDVYLPKEYDAKQSEQKFPVVYIPMADVATGIAKWDHSPTIIVGIGYSLESTNKLEELRMFARDLTPTVFNEWFLAKMAHAGGGAEDYLNFINKELKPFINAHYHVDQGQQTLAGHSLGGLFAVYTLLNHKQSFDNYVISSPSLWWDKEIIFSHEEQYSSTNNDLAKNVYISIGSEESKYLPSNRMVENSKKMADQLSARSYPNLNIEYQVFSGETHESVFYKAIITGLQVVLQEGWQQ